MVISKCEVTVQFDMKRAVPLNPKHKLAYTNLKSKLL